MEKKHGWGALAGVVAVSVALLLVGYVGAYYALVTPISSRTIIWPAYPAANDEAFVFFWPIHQIDRKLRPRVWNPAYVVRP